jgi:threonine aldolase
VQRLKEDHDNARKLAAALGELPYVTNVRPVETNILIFDLKLPATPAEFLEYLVHNGVVASAFGPQTIRFVTHLDVNEAMIDQAIEVLKKWQ